MKLVEKDRHRASEGASTVSSPRNREDETASPATFLDVSIAFLLQKGEEVWGQLCDEGVLRSADWTEDEKWTAIGMMWKFEVLPTSWSFGSPGKRRPREVLEDNGSSTGQMMKAVRRKGKRRLEAMS